MKQNRTFLNWLLLLMMTVGMTSCQGLVDAVFGEADYPAEIPVQPSKPTKQSAIISYATSSIGKTFGDAAFTNVLTNTGDGKVTYATSNTAVATVNSETGEVTITGNGEATITATVADTDKYTYTTKTASYTIGVGTATMTVTAEGFSGTYDGTAHGITVTAPEGATVKYGTAEGTYDLTASPTYTDAGTYTVYYQVTKQEYTTVTGSAVVAIAKAAGTISFATPSIPKTFGDEAFTNPLTKTGDGKVGYLSSNTAVAEVDATTGEVTIKGSGEATIAALVIDGTNYTYATPKATYTIGVAKAAGSISYATASISKNITDAAFTNALTQTGDGSVSYESSLTSVATVNSSTGEVTIVGTGSTVITATVADGTNYSYATKTASYTLTVKPGGLNAPAVYDHADSPF